MTENVWLTSTQMLKRYNRNNHNWLYRRVKNDPTFPRPRYIAGQKYFLLADVEAYERDQARNEMPKPPEPDIAAMKAGKAAAAASASEEGGA